MVGKGGGGDENKKVRIDDERKKSGERGKYNLCKMKRERTINRGVNISNEKRD